MTDVRRPLTIAVAILALSGCAATSPRSTTVQSAEAAGPAIQSAALSLPAPDNRVAEPEPPEPPRAPAPADLLGCERPAAGWSAASTSRLVLDVDPSANEGERQRAIEVDVPQGPVLARPLLLVLHSHAADIRAARGYGWSNLPVADPPVVVYAQGLAEGRGGPPAWASAGRTDFGIDDVAFLRAAVAAARTATCVDGRRIYAAGFSNGGSMAALLGCQAADLFAGVLSVAGNYYPIAGGCQPSRGVGVVEMHAVDDPVVAYAGGPGRAPRTTTLPRVPDWVAGWTARDGCPAQMAQSSPAPGALRQLWRSCRDGASVVHVRIDRFGHRWPDAGATTNDLWLWGELTAAARA
ncbi:MAG: prolyl oligopeptidase family serine peptidase [Actinomycetota bacterium]|nr:prolyl oligopeptidase family serine peptidase [Actinomycetota bacterium]